MKHLFVAASIAFLCFLKPATAAEIQEVVSPGGVIAWLIEEHSIPLISVEYEFTGGSSSDPQGKEGLAYLASGLLNEGAGDLNARAFQKRLDELAIRMSFDADADQMSGSLQTLTDNAEDAFQLLGMALADPSFDQDAVDRVKQQVLAIQRRESQRPRSVAVKAWMASSFEDHPYGRRSKGDEASIIAITADDLHTFTQRHFALDNVIIGVVGDIDAQTLGEFLDLAFADLSEEADVDPIANVVPARDYDVDIIDQDVPQSTVIFGSNGLRRNDPDWYTAIVMNYVLGSGGFASRLTEEVRRKRGLAYGVSTQLVPRDHAGLFIGTVATQNARVGESVKVIRDEIQRMADFGISPQELVDAKTYLTGSYALRFGTSKSAAAQLVGIQRYGLGMNYIDRRNDYIDAVSIEQVNRVAKRLLQTDNLFWVIVGRPEGLPEDMSITPDASQPQSNGSGS